MGKEFRETVNREVSLHNGFRERDLQIALRNSPPQFIVIGQVIDNRLESTDGMKFPPAKGQRGSEAEANAGFNLPCRQNSRGEIRADAQRLQFRTQGGRRNSAVEAGDQRSEE